jgi:hypothetical protein
LSRRVVSTKITQYPLLYVSENIASKPPDVCRAEVLNLDQGTGMSLESTQPQPRLRQAEDELMECKAKAAGKWTKKERTVQATGMFDV